MKKTWMQSAFVAIVALLSFSTAHAGTFDGFGGRWTGSGLLVMGNGASERMTCRATYFPSANRTELRMNVRCASPGLKIEAKGSLTANGGTVSGTFEEHIYNSTGTISGTMDGGSIIATIRGGDWQSSLVVHGYGSSVVLTPHGGSVKRVALTFRRG